MVREPTFARELRSFQATGPDLSNFAEEQQSTEPLAPGDLQGVEEVLTDDFDGAGEAIPPRDDLSDWESVADDENFEPPHVTFGSTGPGPSKVEY